MRVKNPALLRALVEQVGLSQRELGMAAGLQGHRHVGRMLAGEKRTCSPQTAVGLAKALGVEVGFLFDTEIDVPEPSSAAGRIVQQRSKGAA